MLDFRAMANGFPPADQANWQRLVERKGGTVDALRSRNVDGLAADPIYPPGDGPVLIGRAPSAPWTIVQRLDAGDSDVLSRRAEEAITGGANAIEFVFSTSPAAYGRGIGPLTPLPASPVPIRIDAGALTPGLCRDAVAPMVHAVFDPFATLAAMGDLDVATIFREIAGLLDGDCPLAFSADGRPWHNGGASDVQELGIVIASAIESLRRLSAQGCALSETAGRFGVTLAADAEQFTTIAKFRAARLLFARLAEVTGLPIRPPIHAETSWRMLGRTEPMINMLRETTATFAAAVGGADSITVLPPRLADEPLADRMARNLQTVLRDESSLAQTSDPGAGSGAVEALTSQMAAAAWDLFTAIEAEGGLSASMARGSLLTAVDAARDRRLAAVTRGATPMVGVNVNVDPHTALPLPVPASSATAGQLPPIRLSAAFEDVAVRIAPNGLRRPVRLIRIGVADDLGATDALAALGFTVERETSPERSTHDFACLVVGETSWQEAAETARILRANGVGTVIAFASAPSGRDPAFDAIVTPGTDLPGLMRDLLDRVTERQEKEHG